jgi:hypothetical protein
MSEEALVVPEAVGDTDIHIFRRFPSPVVWGYVLASKPPSRVVRLWNFHLLGSRFVIPACLCSHSSSVRPPLNQKRKKKRKKKKYADMSSASVALYFISLPDLDSRAWR